MALINFNANDVQPDTFTPVPAGNYNVIIVESEWNQTKDGTGRFLKLKLQIVDGEHKGRTLFSRLNLENRSTMAVDIARAQLSSICRATGVMQPKDTCELHGIPFCATVSIRKDPETGDFSNDVKRFSQKQDITVLSENTSKKPWER